MGYVPVKNYTKIQRPPFRMALHINLLTNSELLNERAVAKDVLLREIIEETAALTYHLQKSALTMMVLCVLLKVWCERVDVLCKKSDLYFGRTGIILVLAKFGDKLFRTFY